MVRIEAAGKPKPKPRQEQQREKTARDIAIEFAKNNVPRPKIASRKSKDF